MLTSVPPCVPPQSNCFTLRETSDAEDYAAMRGAMTTMNIGPAEQDGIFRTLSGLLHLG